MIQPIWAQNPPTRGECGSSAWSECWWCRRCVATQKIGPPSSVSVPQTARKYSNSLNVLNPRCVWRRWYPMLMPSPTATQYNTRATMRFVQLKANNAATACTWNQISTPDVRRLTLLYREAFESEATLFIRVPQGTDDW